MKKLKAILSQEDTVIFVGSGISTWSGIPNWKNLIQELADFLDANDQDSSLVRRELNNNDLLQAASYGFAVLSKPQIGEFIRSVTRRHSAKPSGVHQLIMELQPKCFITTNYDDLIEQSVQLWRGGLYRVVTNKQLTETAEIIGAKSVEFIFKPHGDAADADSIILTREQYRTLQPNGGREAALRGVKNSARKPSCGLPGV
jgi:hypothetical protein